MNKIKLLVVDDSSVMRKLISQMVGSDPEIEVVATAMNGIFALQKIEKYDPDMILLDIEMPQMDGVEFLIKRRELNIHTPVVVLSSMGRSRPELTLKCIELGASDFIMKPGGAISLDIEQVKEEVIAKIKYFNKKNTRREIDHKELKKDIQKIRSAHPVDTHSRPSHVHHSAPKQGNLELKDKINKIRFLELVAIGISTGGPNALREILPTLPADFPLPIVIVQHMPPGFTKEFAKGLDEICQLSCKEAEDGDVIEKGWIYIAPGNKHIIVNDHSGKKKIKLDDSPPVCGHKPSAEYLFENLSEIYGNRVLAAIMTGMGRDGAKGIKKIWKMGGYTIAQNEASCVVFGMPKVAIEEGGIDEVLELHNIPKKIVEITYAVLRKSK